MTQIAPIHNVKRTSVRLAAQRAEFRAGIIALVIGVLLMAIKFYAYFLTHSNAVYSDALETIVNVVAACFALYAIVLAHRPADQEHPYGHGKVEFFSSGLEGGMVLLAAVIIVGKVAVSLFHGAPPVGQNIDTGLGLMGGAMVLNGGLGTYLFFTGKRHNSITLQASGAHLMTDAVDSIAVLAALIIVRFTGWRWVDPVAALMVATYIAWLALGLVKRSAAGLMDQQDATDQNLLRQILDSHIGPNGKDPQICSYHKLRHRHNGRYHWVDFHLMVPGWWNIDRGHRLASAIEYEIELALGEGNATAHVEPCVDPNCPLCQNEKSKQ